VLTETDKGGGHATLLIRQPSACSSAILDLEKTIATMARQPTRHRAGSAALRRVAWGPFNGLNTPVSYSGAAHFRRRQVLKLSRYWSYGVLVRFVA
jgi:hypothetical protein